VVEMLADRSLAQANGLSDLTIRQATPTLWPGVGRPHAYVICPISPARLGDTSFS